MQISISAVTLDELAFSAEYSQQAERNLADIAAMVARLEVFSFENKAAYRFGQIREELYSAVSPIGPYGMMMAGHVRASGLILVTNNVKEFEQVPGLKFENWSEVFSKNHLKIRGLDKIFDCIYFMYIQLLL